MQDKELLVRTQDGVLWLTIHRPDRRNALNAAVLGDLRIALEAARGDRSLRAVVLTGSGEQAFCAGADLGSGAFHFDYSEPRLPLPDLFRLARSLPIPLVARVNGACMAGGMGLLAMCDLALAVEDAVFGLPEVKVGVYPMQVLSLLQHLVPRRRLMELCFAGQPVPAGEALEMGLLNRVVGRDGLDASLETLLHSLKACSPTALRRGKYATYAIETMAFEESLQFMEGQIGLLAATQDAAEGLAAFREKRSPAWAGR